MEKQIDLELGAACIVMENLEVYVLFFCRFAVILLFAFSFITKIVDINNYASSIGRFNLIPSRFSKIAAVILIAQEFLIVVLLLLDIRFQVVGFGIASVILLIFTFAIGAALFRGLRISCNCFGASEKRISTYDILRNILFIICSVIGLTLLISGKNMAETPTLVEAIIVSFWAIAFLQIATNLSNVASLFEQNFNKEKK